MQLKIVNFCIRIMLIIQMCITIYVCERENMYISKTIWNSAFIKYFNFDST